MSRPRPPLHDPYGLLRQPPPEAPASLYSATSNALTSTTSLPLPTSSPNRRNRLRGISPSRTQHGEEYEDQPYLTNVMRHHGQVTLVPPVNQGRVRKGRGRRNPEATASTVSLADTLAGPSTSSPGRVSARSQPRPRRPRQGSEARAVSSPDVGGSPYPDYPPPSFEEVLALDRNNASSSTPISPPPDEPARANEVPSPMFLVSAPPSLSDPAHDPIATATPWEHDRLLGLSLEERVRREYERNMKPPSGSESSPVAINTTTPPQPSSPVPASGSPTATSVTASNFLTPQNLSPSPSGAALPLSTTNSPKASEPPLSPSPPPVPPKSPELIDTPTARTSETPLDHDAGPLVRNAPTGSHVPRPAELNGLSAPASSQVARFDSASSERVSAQETPNPEVPLTSLLFTTRLRLDSSPERSPVRESRREPSPDRKGRSKPEAGGSQVAAKESIENASERRPFPRVHRADQIVPLQESTPGPFRPTSPLRNSSPSLSPVIPRSPSPKLPSPITPSVPITPAIPTRATPEPSQPPSTVVPRRPPPPPPPRRQRQVGSGVAARISAYEALLANAPKVPPPIPPRPRPRAQTTSDAPAAQPERNAPEVPTGATSSNAEVEQTVVSPEAEAQDVSRDAHIASQPSPAIQRPRLPPRPASVHTTLQLSGPPSRPTSAALQDITSPTSRQFQSNHSGSRPLSTPGPSRPERPMSVDLQVPVLVPPRIGLNSIRADGASILRDTHISLPADSRPRSLSRPASAVHQAVTSPDPASQPRGDALGPRPLSRLVSSQPEHPVSANVEAQALVPARIGPDGKLEIIPDAEVIWLDKPNGGTPEPQTRPSGSRTLSEQSSPLLSVPPESVAGPSNRESEVNPFEDSFLSPLAAPPMSRQSPTTSSVFPTSPVQAHPPVPDPGPPTSATATTESSTVASPPPRLADDFEYTDLDLLISRLEENEASRQGANYEQLLTVGEVLGPAHPPAPRPDFDLNVGLIEIQRRRVMKDGRVKLKLSLMGVGVDKCGICLTQFKNNESAVLLPCLHSFHTNCIMSWFVRQEVPACPHCRALVTQ